MHHVTARTPSGRLLFAGDDDRRRYLQLLAREVRDRRWSVLTFCQMSNHVHALVRTPGPDLGLGMKRIHEDYARYVNRRHGQQGHVFGARFYNGLVQDDHHAVGCLRYIARNPVDAGMCDHADDWPWSAHRALAGLTDVPDFLDLAGAYELLGPSYDHARVEYVRLVARCTQALLADLRLLDPSGWMLQALDHHAVTIDELAAFLGITSSAAYRRVAKTRATVGTGPGVACAAGGTGPGGWSAQG
jgi:REP-associated tyrosine transposase